MNETRNNALRLAYAIQRQADESKIQALANLLNYDRAQLAKDIDALASYVSEYSTLQREAEE